MLGLHHCFCRPKRHLPPPPNYQTATNNAGAVFKNFNSVYDPASDTEDLSAASQTLTLSSSSSSPDLSAAIASRRLLSAAPGRSKSIADSSSAATATATLGFAVETSSPDPYGEFRRSMEEMVAALGIDGGDRAVLHELLLCYLALNRKGAHKYIIGAFNDILAHIRQR